MRKLLITLTTVFNFAAATAQTQINEQLSMQCGQHKIVLTCGHSDEIAIRQKKNPRLCNDNTVEFISNNGSFKKFGTYIKGTYKDSTPVRLYCRAPSSGKKFHIAIVMNNSANVLNGVIVGFAENGMQLIDEQEKDIAPTGYASFLPMPGEAGYANEAYKKRPAARLIEIKEIK